MKFLRFYILNRPIIILVLIIVGVVSHVLGDPVIAWICYVLALISIVLYFMLGTMRLVQDAFTNGDADKAIKYINMIKFPKLLFKPIRATYYMMQSQFSMVNADLNTAEKNIRKSMATKSSIVGDMEGTNLMQLGFIQLRKGDSKEARKTLTEALKKGIPDKEAKAGVLLQLTTLEIQRNNNRLGKEYFKKAKALNPKTPDIVDQIKTMEKNISRLPG